MKRVGTVLMLVALWLGGLGASVNGAVVQIGEYHMGEAGTVGSTAPYAPLVDTEPASGANSINNYNVPAEGTPLVITTGLAAPNSTAAIYKSTASIWAGWYQTANGYGLADNWAVDFWIRPGDNGGTYGGATDADNVNGLVFWLTNNGFDGDGVPRLVLRQEAASTEIVGPQYALGTWYRWTVIVRQSTVYSYVDGDLKGSSAAFTGHDLNDLRFSLGPGFLGGVGTIAAYDECTARQLMLCALAT